jgi:hypothetical protein
MGADVPGLTGEVFVTPIIFRKGGTDKIAEPD